MKRLRLTPAQIARLPAMTFAPLGTDAAGVTAVSAAGPKLRKMAAFPGFLFRKVSSIYELMGECNGICFKSGTGYFMFVGSAVNDLCDRGFFPTMYNARASGPTAPKLSSVYNSELAGAWPYHRSPDGRSGDTRWPAPWIVAPPSGTITEVMGVICDADWGFGSSYANHFDNGSAIGAAAVRRLPMGRIGKIIKDKQAEMFLNEAGKAEPYVKQAVTEWLLTPEAQIEFSVPMVYRNCRHSGFNGFTWGLPGVTDVYVEEFGLFSPVPMCERGNAGVYGNNDGIFLPMKGRLPCVPFGPIVKLADIPGNKWIADVRQGMALASNIAPDGTRPGDTDSLVGGISLDQAITLALSAWNAYDPALASPGLSTVPPVYNAQNQPISVGSFGNVTSWPQEARDIMDGPVGYHGYTAILDAVLWITRRAEDIAKAAL